MSARTPPARYRRKRVRASRLAGKLPPLVDVVATLDPLGDLGPLEDDAPAEPYRVPEVVEDEKRRRMN